MHCIIVNNKKHRNIQFSWTNQPIYIILHWTPSNYKFISTWPETSINEILHWWIDEFAIPLKLPFKNCLIGTSLTYLIVCITEVIGRGNFGIVHKAILEQENEQHVVAVKTVSGMQKRRRNKSVTLNLYVYAIFCMLYFSGNILGEGEFLAEINLLISLGSHANIASIIGCCTTKDNPILLVTEYMMYGDLLHFMWDIREPSGKNLDKTHCLKQRDLYDIGRQVADGMAHLKNMKVIHGDLAARNILVGEVEIVIYLSATWYPCP